MNKTRRRFVIEYVADILGYQNGSRDINRHVDDEDKLTKCFTDSDHKYRNGTFTVFCRIQLNIFTKAAGGRAAPAPESSRQGGGAYGYIYRIISVRNYDLRRYNLSVICK